MLVNQIRSLSDFYDCSTILIFPNKYLDREGTLLELMLSACLQHGTACVTGH